MTNFAWWAAKEPPGRFMCCLCFESVPITLANKNEDGDLEDVCLRCAADERRIMRERGLVE